ncbi:MAG: RelA/SpoT family protein [Spirochaetia bacterium]|nr:RelA/SpoT family protein [Spirochaetia bacterium]
MARIDKELEILEKKLINGDYCREDVYRIMRAAGFGKIWHDGQKRASGEPYFIHPIQVASILIDLNLDYETIIAALLHDTVEDTDITLDFISQQFGPVVATLVDGVTKISLMKAKNKSNQSIETIRKIVIAMAKDIRVIFIKLADRLHNMRTLDFLSPDRQKAMAKESLEIYAQLAGQLGLSEIKGELEDLSLKYLNPAAYKKIRHYVTYKRTKIETYLEEQQEILKDAARKEGIEIKTEARAKHIYSIYQKMLKYDVEPSELYDLIGVRVFCQTVTECYAMLGIVHKMWAPVENRLKDYISIPKPNGYQSLHTTVSASNGKFLEVQIRTYAMHMTAEYGIAAHWLYKSGKFAGTFKPKDIALINRLKSWTRFNVDKAYFLDDLKEDILKDTIFVFTPNGDVIEMPKGSTPIDFAYYIHSEVGNHCKAAKINGTLVPLGKELLNDQCVEIITSSSAHPNLYWLRIARTSRARSKIRSWINKYDKSLLISKSIVIESRDQLRNPDFKKSSRFVKLTEDAKTILREAIDKDKVKLKLGDEQHMMVNFAKCCSPAKGDEIIGYVSVGRGIIVHKKDCPNVKNINNINLRKINIEWAHISQKHVKRYKLEAEIVPDLLTEIEGAIKSLKGHIVDGQLMEEDGKKLSGFITIEMDRKKDFIPALKEIKNIPSILEINEVI